MSWLSSGIASLTGTKESDQKSIAQNPLVQATLGATAGFLPTAAAGGAFTPPGAGGGGGPAYTAGGINVPTPISQDQVTGAIGQAGTALGGFNPLMQAGTNLGVYGQQQQLANMLMQQAQGQGPNPAQNMLNQATGQNMNQQAALMGSQRGVGANPALMAKQAAMQGSQIQQQAAGQAATMGANQQLAAQQALGNQQAQMAGQNMQMQNAYTQAAQAHMQSLLGGFQNQTGQQIQQNLGVQGINAGAAQQQAAIQAQKDIQSRNQQGQMLGGLLQAGGMIAGGMFGGPAGAAAGGAVGGALGGAGTSGGGGMGQTMMPFADGGEVKASYPPASPAVDCRPRPDTGWGAIHCKAEGGIIEGTPKVNHNSLQNDTVHALLSPGELVIPLDSMKSKAAAMKFVQDHFNKKSKK